MICPSSKVILQRAFLLYVLITPNSEIFWSDRIYVNETYGKEVNLDNFTSENTAIIWNFVGSSFIKYDDVYIKPSAGIIFIFPNLGGCIQVFFDYNDPSFFKMRKKYSTTWSKWYSYNGTENTL